MAGVRIETIAIALRPRKHRPRDPQHAGADRRGHDGLDGTPSVVERPGQGRVAGVLLACSARRSTSTHEKYVDMATAVSSSGPAYVFLVIEAMIDAAVHIGLRREMAVPMVLQTVLGSARYAQESGQHPAELRNQVTSPGGTTTEGLLVLEDGRPARRVHGGDRGGLRKGASSSGDSVSKRSGSSSRSSPTSSSSRSSCGSSSRGSGFDPRTRSTTSSTRSRSRSWRRSARFMPRIGMFDLSPMIATFLL